MDCSSVVEKDGTFVLLHTSGSDQTHRASNNRGLLSLRFGFIVQPSRTFLHFTLTFRVIAAIWGRFGQMVAHSGLKTIIAGADFGENIGGVRVGHAQMCH